MEARWEHFEHGADIGVRGFGSTPGEAFAQAAMAMTAAVAPLERIGDSESACFDMRAPNLEYLLLDWLNALIFEMATRHLLFARFEVSIRSRSLHARAFGEVIDRERHQPGLEPKGATFTALEVRQLEGDSWLAQCVIDV